jgi:hypothetical protein
VLHVRLHVGGHVCACCVYAGVRVSPMLGKVGSDAPRKQGTGGVLGKWQNACFDTLPP